MSNAQLARMGADWSTPHCRARKTKEYFQHGADRRIGREHDEGGVARVEADLKRALARLRHRVEVRALAAHVCLRPAAARRSEEARCLKRARRSSALHTEAGEVKRPPCWQPQNGPGTPREYETRTTTARQKKCRGGVEDGGGADGPCRVVTLGRGPRVAGLQLRKVKVALELLACVRRAGRGVRRAAPLPPRGALAARRAGGGCGAAPVETTMSISRWAWRDTWGRGGALRIASPPPGRRRQAKGRARRRREEGGDVPARCAKHAPRGVRSRAAHHGNRGPADAPPWLKRPTPRPRSWCHTRTMSRSIIAAAAEGSPACTWCTAATAPPHRAVPAPSAPQSQAGALPRMSWPGARRARASALRRAYVAAVTGTTGGTK